MLEKIIQTRTPSVLKLFFKTGIAVDEVFDAIIDSFINFYESKFVHELVNKPFSGKNPFIGYTDYLLKPKIIDGNKAAIKSNRLSYTLHGIYSYGNSNSKLEEERMLGYINVDEVGLNQYLLIFSISDPDCWNRAPLKTDYNVSKKHTLNYFKYIRKIMYPPAKDILHMVKVSGVNLESLGPGGDDSRVLLLRKLRKSIDTNITFPFIFLGTDHIIDQLSPTSVDHIPTSQDLHQKVDWLYDCIENLDEHFITDKLTGRSDNVLRTIAYCSRSNYAEILPLLEEKMGGRYIRKSSLKL